MQTLKLTGESPRCWWCGKTITGEARKIHVTFGAKEYETVVCSPEHEEAVAQSFRYIKKTMPVFWIGTLAGLILFIAGKSSSLSFVGLLVMGITLFICPFTTPQTTEILGLQKSFRIGRIMGILLSLGAIGLLLCRLWFW
jgi:hypothetical protein